MNRHHIYTSLEREKERGGKKRERERELLPTFFIHVSFCEVSNIDSVFILIFILMKFLKTGFC